MTAVAGGAELAFTEPALAGISQEFEHVLAGVVLNGEAARLAWLLDRAFLAEVGWNPAARVLSPPAGHRLLGRAVCRVGGCTTTAHAGPGGVCHRCCTRLTGQGLTKDQIAATPQLPPLPARVTECAVPRCQREPTVTEAILCEPHARQFRRRAGKPAVGQFLADPRVRPFPPFKPCAVVACARAADSARGYCNPHYQRWRTAVKTDPGLDPGQWQVTEGAVAEGGQVSLHGLPPLLVVQVLFGIWQRTRGGTKIKDVDLRAACWPIRPASRPKTPGTWRSSVIPGGCRLAGSPSRGCVRRPSGGRLRSCRGTAAKAPPTSGQRSTHWPGCRRACGRVLTTDTCRPPWAGPTSRTS